MNEIPEEIRKMFPGQPIHSLDIDDNGELHILASAEPLEPDPHFEDMPIEQVNQYLLEHGYDPEQVGLRGKILADALIENIELRAELAALQKAVIVLRDMLKENSGEYAVCRADNLPMTTYDHMMLSDVQGEINALLPEPPEVG